MFFSYRAIPAFTNVLTGFATGVVSAAACPAARVAEIPSAIIAAVAIQAKRLIAASKSRATVPLSEHTPRAPLATSLPRAISSPPTCPSVQRDQLGEYPPRATPRPPIPVAY